MQRLKPWQYLSPIDCFIPPQYVRQTICFPAKHGRAPILTLRNGLERTVSLIPHLSSNVVPSSSLSRSSSSHPPFKLNRFALAPSNHHKITNIFSEGPSDLVRDLEYERLQRAGFPNNILSKDVFLPALPHFPASDGPAQAFGVRVTQIPGGLILGVCCHHGVTDLGSLDTILKTWAYFCKQSCGEGIPSRADSYSPAKSKPSTDGPVIECDRRIVCGPVLDKDTEAVQGSALPADIRVLDVDPPVLTSESMATLPLETAHFRISTRVLQDLKARLQKHLPAGARLSSNDVICAMMWSATTHAMSNLISAQSRGDGRDGDEVTVSMGLSVDMRRRLDPQIPNNFIGNALAMAWPTVARRSLLDATHASRESSSSPFASLAQVAACVRKSQESLDGKYFSQLVAYLGANRKVTTRLQWGPGPTNTNMVAATWRGMNVVGSLDWGDDIGECDAVRTRLPFPHTITILPQTAGTQGIDVAYCLLAPTMQRLRRCKIIEEYWQVVDGGDMSEGQGAAA